MHSGISISLCPDVDVYVQAVRRLGGYKVPLIQRVTNAVGNIRRTHGLYTCMYIDCMCTCTSLTISSGGMLLSKSASLIPRGSRLAMLCPRI